MEVLTVLQWSINLGVGWKRGKAWPAAMRDEGRWEGSKYFREEAWHQSTSFYVSDPATGKSLRMRNYERSGPEAALSTWFSMEHAIGKWNNQFGRDRGGKTKSFIFKAHFHSKLLNPLFSFSYQNFPAPGPAQRAELMFYPTSFPFLGPRWLDQEVDLNPTSWLTGWLET